MPEQYYFDDLWEGEVVLRDRYQLELKSLYSPLSEEETNDYSLEFYFFLPAALQVNRDTYSREQFYSDLTSLIRYKTPEFTVRELINTSNPRSPIFRIQQIIQTGPECVAEVKTELKLVGNILRSMVRDRVRILMEDLVDLRQPRPLNEISQELDSFLDDLTVLRRVLTEFFDELLQSPQSEQLTTHIQYVDEFFSIALEEYLTRLLKEVRGRRVDELAEGDQKLRNLIASEATYRTRQAYASFPSMDQERNRESRTYRSGLLNKFVMDVLLLSIQRHEPLDRAQHLIGSFAAGVAMFIYMLLFVLQGSVFVINSAPFIILTTLFYVLKDRLKDLVKSISAKKAMEFYPDFTTSIRTPDGGTDLGTLNESFTFIKEKDLPEDVARRRVLGTNRELPEARRLQNIVYYRRGVSLQTQHLHIGKRRYELNDIFRFNISRFLRKSSDPIEDRIIMDRHTGTLVHVPYPKTYHINLVLKQSYTNKEKKKRVLLKKIRLVVDRDGIRRIERVNEEGEISEH